MSQVLELVSLQAVDAEAASMRAALADVERRLQGDEELAEARRVLTTAEAEATAARREQRRVEGDVEDLSDRIARDEARLYDGSIRIPKELASLQHEVETLKGNRGLLEDKLIGLLDAAEGADRQRAQSATSVRAFEERWRAEQDALRHESLRLQDAVARADQRREAQKAKVVPRALALYEDLRRRKGGLAVARISGSSCMGCRVSIPDALRRRAMDVTELAQCPNCERILALG
jgi:hypothetical protein